MPTPYVTSSMLLAAPASLSWNIIPALTNPAAADQTAQVDDACRKATSIVDAYCHQPLRATVYTEELTGPGEMYVRVNRNNGVATIVTRRRPVTSVAAVQVSGAATFPPAWALVPSGQYRPQHVGGNTIDIAPGWVHWVYGRDFWRVLVSYTHGWPHTSLTADAAEGATTIAVDDVTAWAGASGMVIDGQFTEDTTITTTAASVPLQLPGAAGTVQAGPGTLTLAAALTSSHGTGTVVSAMPASVLHATALAAAVQALEMIDAIAVQSMNGQSVSVGALAQESELLLDPYKATI